jgi:hypothetical protein
MQWLRDEAIEL